MPIIIIADAPEEPVATPEVAPAPAPVQAPAPRKKPVKPRVEITPEMEAKFYDQMNSIATGFHQAQPQEQEQWLQSMADFPFSRGGLSGKMTLKDWVTKRLNKDFNIPWDDAATEAHLLIWEALKNWKPGSKIVGWLDKAVENLGRTKKTQLSSGPESDRFKEAFEYLNPYFMYIRNPSMPEAGAKEVDPDIMQKIEDGVLTPAQGGLAMANRNRFNDYYDEATGKTRIQLAKEKFDSVVKDLATKMNNPALMKIKNDRDFSTTRKIVMQNYPEYAQQLNDKSSPYWLTSEMLYPRGLGKETLELAWERSGGGADVSLDKPEGFGDSGVETMGQNVTPEQFQHIKGDPAQFSEQQKKTIIEDAPYEYLELFTDPDERQAIEERLPAIQPYVPVKDSAGNVIMQGGRPKMQKNPSFQPTVESMVEQLYGPSSPPRKIVDDRGRPKGTPAAEQRTKEALYMIGQFYAQSLSDNRDEQTRLKDLEHALRPLVQQPLLLKHYDGGPLGPNQQYAFALREVMLDLMESLPQFIPQLGQQMVAEIKKWIRTASLLAISNIIARN